MFSRNQSTLLAIFIAAIWIWVLTDLGTYRMSDWLFWVFGGAFIYLVLWICTSKKVVK